MRPHTLEAHAIRAVEALRSGVSPEDDFTEIKSRWPLQKTARQLAGLCNKAAGETVFLLVGVDEKTGQIVNAGDDDPADWWAGVRGQFDETPPDLLLHIVVTIGRGESFYALAFGTERAPYVVSRQPNGFDVPFRDGTGTRSAHRHELLQMLLPTVDVPPLTVLAADLELNWREYRPANNERINRAPEQSQAAWLDGAFTAFIEHLSPRWTMFPAHGMSVMVTGDRPGQQVSTSLTNRTFSENGPPDTFGVHSRNDGVMVTGPGKCSFHFRAHINIGDVGTYEDSHGLSLTARLPLAGSDRYARVEFAYVRSAVHLRTTPQKKQLGVWHLRDR